MMIDLFTPVVEEQQFHPNFLKTLDQYSSGVRQVLNDWANGFINRDGKFVKEFQMTYNSGFGELYLYAVLKHLKIDIDFFHSSPDFVGLNKNIAIEATTANHAHDDVPEWEKTIQGMKNEDLFEASRHAVIRLSNAFDAKMKKYRKLYSNLEHVKGKPFIIAISNFTRMDFMFQGDVPMQWLLYDVLEQGHLIKKNGTEVPLGLLTDTIMKM